MRVVSGVSGGFWCFCIQPQAESQELQDLALPLRFHIFSPGVTARCQTRTGPFHLRGGGLVGRHPGSDFSVTSSFQHLLKFSHWVFVY